MQKKEASVSLRHNKFL
ncbi:MAG: hypothetical protein KIS69_06195 [Bacteroidetes bacterium]|nr:hypothetical protein [Bacteroidia bacterium]MCW5931244.1 hypothetical protein [Bacteroidota bacterium]